MFAALFVASISVAAAADWKEVSPGGPTICSKGAPFNFYYKKGSVNKLVVEFEGGGACWNDATCTLGTFTTECKPPNDQGVHSSTDARNPFKDWNHVFVPCKNTSSVASRIVFVCCLSVGGVGCSSYQLLSRISVPYPSFFPSPLLLPNRLHGRRPRRQQNPRLQRIVWSTAHHSSHGPSQCLCCIELHLCFAGKSNSRHSGHHWMQCWVFGCHHQHPVRQCQISKGQTNVFW